MYRVLSVRCISTKSIFGKELRDLSHRCHPNLIFPQNVAKNSHQSLVRHMSQTTNQQENPEDTVVVYKGKLEKDILRVKIFSMTTSIVGLAFQPVLYQQASSLPILLASTTVAGFFIFVTPVLLHQLTKKHVNSVTYDKEKDMYTAHTTTFFFQKRKIPIAPGELKVPDNGGMFTTAQVRDVPLMIEMPGFDKHHLIRLLGYDKPLDLQDERFNDIIEEAHQIQEQKEATAAECSIKEKKRSSQQQ